MLAAPIVWAGGAPALSAAILVVFLAGVWASARYAARRGQSDPGAVVVDEVVGQWLAILPVAADPRYYVLAFVLFRLFDIAKPWPCRRLERLHGGMGIMADDVVAGVYAGALTWLAAMILGYTPLLTG